MADKSSLIIETTDYANNNPNQITISNVVPGADSTKLKTWAQMTAALSKDRYVKSTRVDRIELDTDSRPVFPSRTNLRIWTGTKGEWINIINRDDTIEVPFKSGNGSNPTTYTIQVANSDPDVSAAMMLAPSFSFSSDNFSYPSVAHSMDGSNGNSFVCTWKQTITQEETVQVTISLPETKEFKAFSKTWTIHFYDSDAEGGEG